jgi:hypothetical protein
MRTLRVQHIKPVIGGPERHFANAPFSPTMNEEGYRPRHGEAQGRKILIRYFNAIGRAALAALLLTLIPAAAQAAAYIKFDGIDGEAASHPIEEITLTTRVADVMQSISRQTGLQRDQITLRMNGNRLSPQRLLTELRSGPTPCIGTPDRPRRSRQKTTQAQPAAFCYQKIVWTVRQTRQSGVFQLVETNENATTRRR